MAVNVALAKGRIAEKGGNLLEKCGVDISVLKEDTRKLVLTSKDGSFNFFLVKPSDVPTYVEYGIADMGIVGKDTLIEEDRELYEIADLKFGACKLCIAGYPNRNKNLTSSHLKVATKYINTAKKLYANRGEDVELIKLNGSIELAPVIGLSDVIFDIVESGKTLEANGLQVLEEIYNISARLVVNKVSLKTKANELLPLIDKIKNNIEN